jgi:hypothetical protein
MEQETTLDHNLTNQQIEEAKYGEMTSDEMVKRVKAQISRM